MRKDNYVYFNTTNGTARDNGSKSLEKRGTLLNLKSYKREQRMKLKRETTIILLFRLKKKLKKIYLEP